MATFWHIRTNLPAATKYPWYLTVVIDRSHNTVIVYGQFRVISKQPRDHIVNATAPAYLS